MKMVFNTFNSKSVVVNDDEDVRAAISDMAEIVMSAARSLHTNHFDPFACIFVADTETMKIHTVSVNID